jgi:hypothetical protein
MNYQETAANRVPANAFFMREGMTKASVLNLALLLVAALMQIAFLVAALVEGDFKLVYDPATFPADQWLRPLAAIVVGAGLWFLRSKSVLILLISLLPWLGGFLAAATVELLQGDIDRWVMLSEASSRPTSIAVVAGIEFFSLLIAFLVSATWLFAKLIASRLPEGSIARKLSDWMLSPLGSAGQGARRLPIAMRTSEKILAAVLFAVVIALLLKWAEPFSSGYFQITYENGEFPADQWLRLFFILLILALTIVALGIPVLLPAIALLAVVWSAFLEVPLVVIFAGQDRLMNYGSVVFSSLSTLATFTLAIAFLVAAWVVVGHLVLDYKRRVMAWAEKRTDHYAGVDLPVAGSDVRQQVSVLAVLGLIFAFLVPIVGLVLSYAARNDIVVSKGHKTGFDMAVTASIIGWANLILQSLFLGLLIFTGVLAQSLPDLFFGDLF